MKHLACTVAVASACAAGCATVDPHKDYGRARDIIVEHTGQADTYDPAGDALVDQKVTDLLAGGLTVESTVRIALLRNRGFQAMFSQLGASRADVVQSGLLTNPSVSLAFRLPEGGGRSNLVASFGQELVDLWQIPVRKQVALAQLDQIVWKIAQRAVDLAAEAKTRAYDVLARRESERIVNESLRLFEQSYQVADARFRAGEVGRLDLNLARANVLDMRLELLNVQRDRRLAEAALARTLGLSRWPAQWTLKGDLPSARMLTADDGRLVAMALDRRMDALASAAGVKAADGEYRRQWLNIFPAVTAGAELERLERRALGNRKILADTARSTIRAGKLTAPDIQTRQERAFEKRQFIDSIFGPTLQITLPLWDQNQAQIAKAAYMAEEKQKEHEDLLDAIATEVRSAAASARAAADLVRLSEEETLPLARQNVDAARRAYQAGEQSIILLIDSHEAFIAQERLHVEALRSYAGAWAELERAVGGRLPADAAVPASAPSLVPASRPEVNP